VAPGADEATGAAALLEIARVLAADRASLRRPVIVAFFDGQDLGFKGSADYVRTLGSLQPAIKFNSVIDLDAVGFNPNADRLDLLWYPVAGGLRDRVVGVNDRYRIGVSPLNAQQVTDTSTLLDATPFGFVGAMPAVALVERYGEPDATYPGNPYLHTTQDTPDHVTNHRLWLKAAKLALAAALELGRSA
jgi:Zn-dependent M28 family amino/carboxypeptidase